MEAAILFGLVVRWNWFESFLFGTRYELVVITLVYLLLT